MARQILIAPERIAEGKQLYELTQTPVPAIALMMGVSPRTLERRIVQWRWVPRSAPRIETDRALVAAPPPATPAGADPRPAATLADGSANASDLRSANAVRIQQLVATSLEAIDRVLANLGPAGESGAERSARTIAAVTRALQEMSAMTEPDDETLQDDADDDNDPVPRDIDEIREELARRIHALIDQESGTDGAGGIPGAAGDGPVGR